MVSTNTSLINIIIYEYIGTDWTVNSAGENNF